MLAFVKPKDPNYCGLGLLPNLLRTFPLFSPHFLLSPLLSSATFDLSVRVEHALHLIKSF